MNILVVPDVHGRTFWERATELVDKYQRIVFLGDYLDPYSQEGITPDMAMVEFKKIIEFKKKYPKKVTLLLGNHDLHYVSLYFIPSTRRNNMRADEYHELYQENRDLFTCFKVIKSIGYTWIFSHAGITQHWLRQNKLLLSELLDKSLNELLDNKGYKWGGLLEQVSYSRGGDNMWGSPVWADISERVEDNMILSDKTIQVVGHNRVNNLCSFSGVVYTDCSKLISIDTKTKEITYA